MQTSIAKALPHGAPPFTGLNDAPIPPPPRRSTHAASSSSSSAMPNLHENVGARPKGNTTKSQETGVRPKSHTTRTLTGQRTTQPGAADVGQETGARPKSNTIRTPTGLRTTQPGSGVELGIGSGRFPSARPLVKTSERKQMLPYLDINNDYQTFH